MTVRSIQATQLRVGDVLALPFGKTATVQTVTLTRQFVKYRTEYGNSRVSVYEEVLIEGTSE